VIQNRDQEPLAEINVTPLVDVFLVLLVIFMITAPVLKTALEVGLPESDSATRKAARGLVLQLKSNGVLDLEGKDLSFKQLKNSLRSEAFSRAGGDTTAAFKLPVYLAADERVAYGEVVNLLDEIRRAGFLDVGLMTEEERR
jgi:biopolymer transport protein TolR